MTLFVEFICNHDLIVKATVSHVLSNHQITNETKTTIKHISGSLSASFCLLICQPGELLEFVHCVKEKKRKKKKRKILMVVYRDCREPSVPNDRKLDI